MINWNNINTVFLDMDGTLLDLHFDNYFWLTHLPKRYADHKNVGESDAHKKLTELIDKEQGTLNWYCLDYWTETLGLDIRQLKEEVQHLIAFRPHVRPFLEALQKADLRTVLVTNAHHKSLNLKLSITQLDHHVNNIISSHDLGLPKEDPLFWEKLQTVEPFDPQKTLFIDDSLPVLRSAKAYGIAHLLTIQQPDSQKPPKVQSEFMGVDQFKDIHPDPLKD